MTKSRPAPVIPLPASLVVQPAEGPSNEVVEDRKEGIVSSVRIHIDNKEFDFTGVF